MEVTDNIIVTKVVMEKVSRFQSAKMLTVLHFMSLKLFINKAS
jgi:hypothetical protein